ncbi:hypothetical protein ACFP2T_01630 [Plantactinospora solaniradicis]|uniref:Protein kilB n=1 Tax=Plantactinospora solaniradicis TaxID=1723736 RepID=A0ABW1JZI9_9ACTN
MVQVVVALISTLGVLAGVALGGVLSARVQTQAWRRQEAERSVQERRRIYADFLAAARVWRATVMSPDVRIIEASTFSAQRHADGADAAISTLRLRMEVGLIAHEADTTARAQTVVVEVRRLAEARAEHPAGQVPDPIIDRCRRAERGFAAAARAELGSPQLDW